MFHIALHKEDSQRHWLESFPSLLTHNFLKDKTSFFSISGTEALSFEPLADLIMADQSLIFVLSRKYYGFVCTMMFTQTFGWEIERILFSLGQIWQKSGGI